jgi:hypothetical protein
MRISFHRNVFVGGGRNFLWEEEERREERGTGTAGTLGLLKLMRI